MKIPSFLKKKKGNLRRGGVNPDRDWKYSFSIFLVLLISILAIAGYYLWEIKQGTFFNGEESVLEQRSLLDTEKLSRVLNMFDERAEMLDDLRVNPPEVIDPSL